MSGVGCCAQVVGLDLTAGCGNLGHSSSWLVGRCLVL